jgi:hypothetical protein
MNLLLLALLDLRIVYANQRYSAENGHALSRTNRGKRDASLRRALIGYIAAAAVILVAALFLARSADPFSVRSGLGGTFVGTTLDGLCIEVARR